ncbi:MAG: hypothetical protein JWP82_1728 [Humibacillus sp.]|nr:hypothetical protein [Humibacillus sp.]
MRGIVFYGQTGKFTWRMLATVLAGEGICIMLGALVARGLAATETQASPTAYLVVGLGLGVLAFVAAGMLRRPWGITLGWAVQALTLLSALVVPLMLVVGIFFLTMWLVCLLQGHRIDAEVAQRAAAQREFDAQEERGGTADRVGE